MRDALMPIWKEIKSQPGDVYVYLLSYPDGLPFYVGVGTWRRILSHETAKLLTASNAKAETIRKIRSAGQHPVYSIAGWFDSWAEAAEEERRLIALYGRADLGLGPLQNRTNGGQGTAGLKWYESPKRAEGARRAAEKNRGRKQGAEQRAAKRAAMLGHKWSAETLARRSAALKGRPLSDEHRAKLSAAKVGKPPGNKGVPRTLEQRQRMSDARKGWRPSAKVLAAGVAWRNANSEAISTKRKALWADPGYRQMMKARRWPAKQ